MCALALSFITYTNAKEKNMNESRGKSNVLGLIILFIVLTLFGILLSHFYIMFQANAHDIWVNIVANFVVGLVLATLVWLIKRLMRITNDVMSLIVVIVSLAVILFVMWNMWIVLMIEMGFPPLNNPDMISDMGYMFSTTIDFMLDRGYVAGQLRRFNVAPDGGFIDSLLFFNSNGTWSLNGNQWYGPMLSAVWAGELLVIVAFPIMAAYTSVGLYLTELGAWVQVKLMNYGFSAFDDEELDQIASGDIDVILNKPLEAQGEAMHAVAVCYHKGEPTEFIALYNASWDRDGTLTRGRHIMTVELGLEEIDALDAGLQAINYPEPTAAITTDEDINNEDIDNEAVNNEDINDEDIEESAIPEQATTEFTAPIQPTQQGNEDDE